MEQEDDTGPSAHKTERRRRLIARMIDVLGVGIASGFVFFAGALVYSASVGCVDTAFQRTCGDNKVGGAIGLGIIFAGMLLPLIYECAVRRTLGKVMFGLEIVGRDGGPASRIARIKRGCAAWVPMLAVFMGVLATDGSTSSAFGWALSLYTVLLVVLIVARQPTPYEWLSGTRVAFRPHAATPVLPKAVSRA